MTMSWAACAAYMPSEATLCESSEWRFMGENACRSASQHTQDKTEGGARRISKSARTYRSLKAHRMVFPSAGVLLNERLPPRCLGIAPFHEPRDIYIEYMCHCGKMQRVSNPGIAPETATRHSQRAKAHTRDRAFSPVPSICLHRKDTHQPRDEKVPAVASARRRSPKT
jgi:hypothetical protein